MNTLSSSPFDLAFTANEIKGGRGSAHLNLTFWLLLQMVSPVVVSFSLATATIAPGPALVICFCSFPASLNSWLYLSLVSLLTLKKFPSAPSVPETILNIERRPANGSATVLKTKPEKGASGSGRHSISPSPEASAAIQEPRSIGEGMQWTMKSCKRSTPIFFVTDPQRTGTNERDKIPFFKATIISSSDSGSPSRYLSRSSSSDSTTFSTRASRSSETISCISEGMSIFVALPLTS